MIETSPVKPHNSSIESLLAVESSLKNRRAEINEQLPENEKLMTISVFPLLGTEPLVNPESDEHPIVTHDDAISDGRYSLAKDNIQARSERETSMQLPIFRDEKTKFPETLHLNHVLFGPGACGLQATFQCKDMSDAKTLHDQFVVLGPIFLALTAATPIYAGVLADTDCRWNQTSAAVDDRHSGERGHLHARWSESPMFLGDGIAMEDRGLDPKVEEKSRKDAEFLRSSGMDEVMARYFAHLHLRDPLYLSTKAGRHEEVAPEAVHKSICASVWSHVRLKVPDAAEKGMGWRVEFRPMEVQFTDFGNAAFLIFLDLLRQVLKDMGERLELWMPMEKVRDNMERAHARDAVTEQKFWFPGEATRHESTQLFNGERSQKRRSKPVLMSVREVVNGAEEHGWPGLLPLIEQHFMSTGHQSSLEQLEYYLKFIRRRATGEARTAARWMRDIVSSHPAYKQDSVVDRKVCYDLLREVAEISS